MNKSTKKQLIEQATFYDVVFNKITKAKFSLPDAINLLQAFDIDIDD